MTRICVAGAAGRMGGTILREAEKQDCSIVGAIETIGHPLIGLTLREAGICNSDIKILDYYHMKRVLKECDVFISFTTPEAEMQNIPLVASLGIRIVSGTTGLTETQMKKLENIISENVPAIISPNFSIGVNIMFQIVKKLSQLPSEYDFSIIEIHHRQKKDAPSGTAKKLGEIVAKARGYSSMVYGREGSNARRPDELEILSARTGGVPGVHDLVIAGPYEMIRIEHTAFSRNVFALGALFASKWISRKIVPGIYSLEDMLS